jgi:hypothetical protein
MRVAVFSESSADEAAMRVLVHGLLGQPTEPVNLPLEAPPRGWQAVLGLLPTVVTALYFHTDADGLVIVLDADLSPVHSPDHEQTGQYVDECRLCKASRVAARKRDELRQKRPERKPLRLAFGLAVPCIEAWYLHGLGDKRQTEATWSQIPDAAKKSHKNGLKQRVYKVELASLALMTARATEAAERLAQEPDELAKWFPNGFGPLARDVRNWSIP